MRPFFRARRAIFHFRLSAIVGEQLKRSGAFRTKVPLADWTLGIAFDRNQFAILVKNKLAAANSAIRANRARHFRTVDPRVHRARFIGHRFEPGSVFAFTNLAHEWPFREQSTKRGHGRILLFQSLGGAR